MEIVAELDESGKSLIAQRFFDESNSCSQGLDGAGNAK
jgi:hypothetical protein